MSYIEQLQMVIVNKNSAKKTSLYFEKFLSVYFLWCWGTVIMLTKFDILLWEQNIVKM